MVFEYLSKISVRLLTRTNVERSSLALNLLQTVSETQRIHIAVQSGHSDIKQIETRISVEHTVCTLRLTVDQFSR